MQILGEGTFGQVRREGDYAIKRFKKVQHLIQEQVVTSYFDDSPYIVKCLGYNLEKLEMRMKLYDTSLRHFMESEKIDTALRMKIFLYLLCGLSHIHSRNIIHADLKPSNILVRLNPFSTVICDLGLASTTAYGKINQTARAYRLPDDLVNPKNGPRHDLYSLSIVGLELFSGYKVRTQMRPNDLATLIDKNSKQIGDPLITKALRGMALNSEGWDSARTVLNTVFKMDAFLAIPSVPIVPNKLSDETINWFYEEMRMVATDNKIKRGKRALWVLFNRINNRSYDRIPTEEYPLYIVSMIMINSALFGSPGFAYQSAIDYVRSRWNKKDIMRALNDILTKPDLINYLILE